MFYMIGWKRNMKDNKSILWFDIETAPECLTEVERATYPKRKLWEKKSETNEWIEWTFNWYIKKASVYPEFSKVVCVSFKLWDKVKTISIKDSDEKKLLEEVFPILHQQMNRLWWFNIYNFDIPFLWKRYIINWYLPPMWLDIANVKPWELDDVMVDVMQIWKHTSFWCSLDLLSMTLLWESPKSEWTWEYVASALLANNFDWIEKYCEWDVLYAEKCYEYIMNPEEIEIKKPEKSAKEIAEAKMAEPIE